MSTYEILTPAQFEKLTTTFHSDQDALTHQPINLSFSRSAFEETSMPLFQMCAHEKLQNLSGQENIQLSLKYQVLSEETALIGVVK